MKRIGICLLAVLLVLGLCACATENSQYGRLKSWLTDKNGIRTETDTGYNIEAKVSDEEKIEIKSILTSSGSAYNLVITISETDCRFSLGITYNNLLPIAWVSGSLKVSDFGINSMVEFDTYQSYNDSALSVSNLRGIATGMIYDTLAEFEIMVKGSGVDLKALGFASFAADRTSEEEKQEDYRNKPFSERFSFSGFVTLEGMGLIFAVLALLWGILELFHVIMHPKKKTVPAPNQTVTAPSPVPAEQEDGEDDGELAAVITAAVAAYLADGESNASSGGFRVVSFKRTGNGSAWNKK